MTLCTIGTCGYAERYPQVADFPALQAGLASRATTGQVQPCLPTFPEIHFCRRFGTQVASLAFLREQREQVYSQKDIYKDSSSS